MNIKKSVVKDPKLQLELEVSVNESIELERFMSEHSGPQAPNLYKEIIVALRQFLRDEAKIG